jgi:hypothetical protein
MVITSEMFIQIWKHWIKGNNYYIGIFQPADKRIKEIHDWLKYVYSGN